jgi:O-acetylserine/cysteine efflux transporter
MIGSVTLYAAPQLALASLVLESGQLEAFRTATLLDWSAVVTLGIGGFVLAYSIWYGLMQRYRVDQVTPFALLMPPTGVVVGVMFFDERLSFHASIGCLVVIGGLAFILKEPPARKKSSPA